jgi:hypothetical protein
MRQILPDPWENVGEKYHVNDVVEGEVTRLVPFGAFVLLEGGIEGIIPNSELAHRRIAKPGDVVDAGQQVQVKVIDVRPEERRLTLSLRALQARDAAPMVGSGAGPSAPTADEPGTGAGRRAKDRRRGRGGDEDDYVGGGDWRQYSSGGPTSSGVTIGDMFGQMFADAGGKGKGKAGGKRRRAEEDDEDFDPNSFEDDFDPDAEPVEAEAEVEVDAEAGTDEQS